MRPATLIASFLLMGIASAQSPSINWIGCGPSWNGSRVGASCGVEYEVSQAMTNQKVYGWGAGDATFLHGKANNTLSTGLVLDAKDLSLGKWSFHLNLLGAPGVTTTPSATLGTMTYGIHPAVEWRKLTISGGFRGATGGTQRKLWNFVVGWEFGKKN